MANITQEYDDSKIIEGLKAIKNLEFDDGRVTNVELSPPEMNSMDTFEITVRVPVTSAELAKILENARMPR